MKTHAALATIMIAAAIGVAPANAAERTASLIAPASPGSSYTGADVIRQARLSAPDVSAFRRGGFSALERERVEAAVRTEIAALAARDADRAYALLAPAARTFFTDAPTFLNTLNQQMIPVMYAKRFTLIGLEREAGDAVQHVIFTGPKNHEWLARFRLQRQSDGSWLVRGCQVEFAQGQQI